MGSFHGGLLDKKPRLSEAYSDPSLMKIMGIVEPSLKLSQGEYIKYPVFELVVRGKLYQFYRHPELLLIPSILVTIAEYNYDKDLNTGMRFRDVPAKIEEAIELYNDTIVAATKLKEAIEGK